MSGRHGDFLLPHRVELRKLRRPRFELLEPRWVLSASFELPTLQISPVEYSATSILIGLRTPDESSGGDPALFGENVLAGTRIAPGRTQLPLIRKVELSEGVGVADALAAYSAHPLVAYAEPDYQIQLTVSPNDPSFGQLWGLNNEGQTGGVSDADIDAPEAWEVTTGSGGTIVAVIDTGVDYSHADLADNMWVNLAEANGSPGMDDDGNGYIDDVHGYDFYNNDGDPIDDHNHGTHVAGTIGAVGDNGLGVTGVNWDVQIMALKFLNASGSGSVSAAVEALNYAVANGATISNNSWGDYNFSQSLRDAIAAAQAADHIFVAAAGNGIFGGIPVNNDSFPFYPASYNVDNIVAVAATDHEDDIAPFSNFGATTVDLGAPGVNILSTTRNQTYSAFSGTSMATPHVSGVIALIRDLHPEWTADQVIAQVLSTVDPIVALSGKTVSGGRLNAAAAVGNSTTVGPEIAVFVGTSPVADGSGSVSFGTTPPGTPASRTFTVRNVGSEALLLSEPIVVPAGFSVASSFTATTLEPGELTSFTIRLDAEVKGSYSGALSFGTNDADENPFNFTVTGEVDFAPVIVDDGNAGFTSVGEWTRWTNQGYLGDVDESLPGTGADVATWTFAGLTPGEYRVAATWTPYINRASDAPFAIFDGQTQLATVAVDQRVAPAGFVHEGASWQDLGGTHAITGSTLSVTLSDDANGRLNADAIYVKRIGDLPPEPEIEVSSNGLAVVDGGGAIDFGATQIGAAVTRTFAVRNAGMSNLELSQPISVPAGFIVSQNFGSTLLAPGETTSFTVRLDASVEGDFAGEVSFGNNDPDESPFNFSILGSVVAAPLLVDNGDASFTTVGEWTRWSGQGFQNDVDESLPGSGADVAAWSFAGLSPGLYRVSATWSSYFNRATNSPFTLLDGAVPMASVRVNQQVAPNDFQEGAAAWEDLGAPVALTGNTLIVQLTDDANGRVNADAIRIQRVGDLPAAAEIEVSAVGTVIADGTGVVQFESTPPGLPIARTFTVRNVGSAPLTLAEPISVPAGFRIVSSFGATTLTGGEATAFTIELEADALGDYGGEVAFGNNDADENPFNFTVVGAVQYEPSIVDNGDAGFAAVGEWTRWIGQGYLNDVHESLPGTGADVASWTFANLLPGEYRVSATWSAFSNRASNAPFTILEGSVPLTTVLVNQQAAPSDFTDANASWEDLSQTITIAGDTLVVQLSDNANGRLNADAIRVQFLGSALQAMASAGASVHVEQTLSPIPLESLSVENLWRPLTNGPTDDAASESARLLELADAALAVLSWPEVVGEWQNGDDDWPAATGSVARQSDSAYEQFDEALASLVILDLPTL
jgi:subtilisin family serine protease